MCVIDFFISNAFLPFIIILLCFLSAIPKWRNYVQNARVYCEISCIAS